MSRRIDATRLQVGQRIFCRVALDVPNGHVSTGYAMRAAADGGPFLVTSNGRTYDLTNRDVTVEVDIPMDGHHAPWKPDKTPELLPTNEGSLILARSLRGYGTVVLLRLEDVGEGRPLNWVVAGAGDWIDTEDIGDDWVEIDPETLRPVGDSS